MVYTLPLIKANGFTVITSGILKDVGHFLLIINQVVVNDTSEGRIL